MPDDRLVKIYECVEGKMRRVQLQKRWKDVAIEFLRTRSISEEDARERIFGHVH